MLKNAFEGLATDGSIKRLIASLNFARDMNDRLRVIVDGGTTGIGQISWGNYGNWPLPYGTGSSNSVDAREALRQQHRQNFNYIRNTRWTF